MLDSFHHLSIPYLYRGSLRYSTSLLTSIASKQIFVILIWYAVVQARPMLKDRKNILQLADPNLKGQFSEPVFCRAVEVASMCLRKEASTRPSTSDLVLALNYLASQQNHPNKVRGSGARGDRERRIQHSDGQPNDNTIDFNESENSPTERRMPNVELEREQAVAEAKMWGETWREKKRQNAEIDYGNLTSR